MREVRQHFVLHPLETMLKQDLRHFVLYANPTANVLVDGIKLNFNQNLKKEDVENPGAQFNDSLYRTPRERTLQC